MPTLVKGGKGKGYILKKMVETLALDDISLVMTLKNNMKPRLLALVDKIFFRKRSIIETINDTLKKCFSVRVFTASFITYLHY